MGLLMGLKFVSGAQITLYELCLRAQFVHPYQYGDVVQIEQDNLSPKFITVSNKIHRPLSGALKFINV